MVWMMVGLMTTGSVNLTKLTSQITVHNPRKDSMKAILGNTLIALNEYKIKVALGAPRSLFSRFPIIKKHPSRKKRLEKSLICYLLLHFCFWFSFFLLFFSRNPS